MSPQNPRQRPPVIRLYEGEVGVDLFAGGGGASTGIEQATGPSPITELNHEREALAMHHANHPETIHLREDVRDVNPRTALQGRKCGFAWFSPDCTFFSKAKGGQPFRDPERARKIRGLIGVVLKWADAVRPRVIFIENVEEIEFWCPLGQDGRPDPAKRGASFRRWVARLRTMGYVVEWRQLRASHYGDPTSRKRLFIIARCDGQPIVWPAKTHGPRAAQPYRTAAECINFSRPIPSIFLTPKQARAWGKQHGVPSPRRPLATATKRRIARGIQRFVLDAATPFIIPSGEFALVAPTLINTRNGERAGQAPRVYDIQQPFATVTAHGSQGALVAAFLAKHNAGHEATGQPLLKPCDAVTTRDSKALVTSHLVKLRGGLSDHVVTGQDLDVPAPTLTAGGTHLAEVRAFLVKFYGSKKDGCQIGLPLDTVTTKGRFGLVTVTISGEDYYIADIGMRMLTPRELFLCQGFPADYQIEAGIDVATGAAVKFTKQTQTRLVGNSVPPKTAAAILAANLERSA